MVQVTFDTNADTLEELHEAMDLLQAAIARRGGAPKLDMAQPPAAEPAQDEEIDAGLFKIKVKHDDEPRQSQESKPASPVPTLNQLLNDDGLSEQELAKMFREQVPERRPKEAAQEIVQQDEGAYIEIIEYADEKK